ncbi:MAG: transcription termination factor NusA [Armatimonadetes bacterium]|nr:transcription termination factor NusA [Armatimonadota bacterium]
MNGDFMDALRQLEREKEIPMESLVETLERALASAYKKHYKAGGNIRVELEPAKGIAFKVYREQTVVDYEPEETGEITLEEARETKPDAQVGEVLSEEVTPGDFGRIAAQTAKQVVVQSIREVERNRIFDEYVEREGEVVTGVVQRREQRSVIINIGKLEAILPPSEQVKGEPYRFNDRIKVYILEVRNTPKGPQVLLSRTHPSLIRRLFELEVPEIEDGTVVIKSVAREPGERTKIAVATEDEKVDPVGACVGHRGSRVQSVVNELYGEKIDIVRWRDHLDKFVEESLSPAKVSRIYIGDEGRTALVIVPDNQLSLAIGKQGQNVRLAARLTGLKIDIRSEAQMAEMEDSVDEEESVPGEVEPAAASAVPEGEETEGVPVAGELHAGTVNEVGVVDTETVVDTVTAEADVPADVEAVPATEAEAIPAEESDEEDVAA